jgi:hypothetical protein
MLAVFELLMGAFVQPVNKHTAKVRIKTRRIIFNSLIKNFSDEYEQQAFQRWNIIYCGFLHD